MATYTYDAENRLTQASGTWQGNATTSTHAYGPNDRRVQTDVDGQITRFVYAGDDVIAEFDATGSLLRRFVHGGGVDEPVAWIDYNAGVEDGRYFYHADHAGTVVALSDDTGDLYEQYSYSSFGEVGTESTSGNPYRFTGRRLDAKTGLYYYRARYYSADLGRFLQTDPIGYEDQMNLYAYVGNDPVNIGDPTGREFTIFYGGELIGGIGPLAAKYAGGKFMTIATQADQRSSSGYFETTIPTAQYGGDTAFGIGLAGANGIR